MIRPGRFKRKVALVLSSSIPGTVTKTWLETTPIRRGASIVVSLLDWTSIPGQNQSRRGRQLVIFFIATADGEVPTVHAGDRGEDAGGVEYEET